MARLDWLPDALRAGGCRVREEPGWRNRGHGSMSDIRGVLCHHTGAAGMPGARNVVRDGRAGLRGPLAQLTLDPDGTFSVIAAGQAWHSGKGGPLLGCPKNRGNSHLIGIEGVSNGTRWTAAQRDAYPRGVAALLRHLRVRNVDKWVAGHKEWAPGRKPDPGNWDMRDFRAVVARHLAGPGIGGQGSAGEGDEDMNPDQDRMLREVHNQLLKGWPAQEGFGPDPKTLVDYVRALHFEITKALSVDGGPSDTILGHAAHGRNDTKAIREAVVKLREQLTAVETALANASGERQITR